jgi:RNA polymerase sigma factor (sigma-70 family)
VTTRARHQPVAPPRHDGELLAELGAGDLAALGLLYDRHYPAVLRFAERIARRGSDAEDVAQETFLVAARNACAFDGRASSRPWLFGIAARILMQRSRARMRLAKFLTRLSGEPHPTLSTPHDAAERRELRSSLADALDGISPAKRIVIVMAESEGFSCEEIAASLNIPVGTVWTRLHHARRELRARLERRKP